MVKKSKPSNLTITQSIDTELYGKIEDIQNPDFNDVSKRYTLKGEKGRGGIGKVYIAMDEHMQREIAIKELMYPEEKNSNGLIEPLDSKNHIAEMRFLKEAKVTGQLEHPGIVPVYEIGKKDGIKPYYTMRLVRGDTLLQEIKDAKDLQSRLRLLPHFRDICNAIAYAHSRGVVHRDIKPENIMIGEFGETVVLDWGLAKIHGEKDHRASEIKAELKLLQIKDIGKTVSGKALGTPAYMSPEQAKGKIDIIDERSDIYSLGAVLYEILAGLPPFDGKNAWEIVQRVIHEEPIPITDFEPLAPPDLCAIVEKTLTKNKDERYNSAREVAIEIENYMSGGKVEAYEYSSWELLKRFVRQNKAISTLIILLVFTLVAGSTLIFNAYRESVSNERMAHLNLALGYQENADRLIREYKFQKAKVFAAASLYNNPYNPYSPLRFPEKSKLESREAQQQLLLAQSSLYASIVYQNDAFIGTLAQLDTVIHDMEVTKDGKLVILAAKDKTIKLWDIKKEKFIDELKGHKDVVYSVDISTDGKLIASGSWDGTVKIWDRTTRTELFTLFGHQQEVNSVAFHPTKHQLASGGNDKIIIIWDLDKKTIHQKFIAHKYEIRSLAFSPDGKKLITSASHGEMKLWDAHSYRKIKEVNVHRSHILSVEFSPDNKYLASAGYDKTVRVFNTQNMEQIAVFRNWDIFYTLSFSPDSAYLVAGARNENAILYDMKEKKAKATLRGHDGLISAISFSSKGSHIFSASEDNTIKLWKTDISKKTHIFKGHKTYISSIHFTKDGKELVSSSWDGSIRIWDRHDESQSGLMSKNKNIPFAADISTDDQFVISGGNTRKLLVWSKDEQKELFSLSGHTDSINAVAIHPNNRLAATGSGDETVKLWDLQKKTLIRTLHKHNSSVNSIAFSPDGKYLASGSRDNTVIIWETNSGNYVTSMKAHSDTVISLVFTHDSKQLFSASEDKTIRLWSIARGSLIKTFRSHHGKINNIQLSPDGKHLLSIGDKALLWDVSKTIPVQLISLVYAGYSCSFSPNGSHFAISDGPIIKVFPLILDHWQKDAHILLQESENESGKKLQGFRLINK